MNVIVSQETYTPEDLLGMRDGHQYELVNGHLVEKHMGSESSWVGGKLHTSLNTHCQQHHAGWAFPADTSYQCFPNAPKKVRKPDTSFIAFGRLPGEKLPKGHIPIAPDLAVEVVSPKDLFYEVEERVHDFLQAGTRLVWVVSPPQRIVFIFRADGSIVGLREQDELSGEDVVPGFRCRIRDLFPPQPPQSGNGSAS
jgi:Uma2 family endonuclease